MHKNGYIDTCKTYISILGKNGVSSVAVLGHMGIVLGNISMTDVKVIYIYLKELYT
jgi:hypothetical protein